MSFELISLDTLELVASEYGYWAVFLGIVLENMGIPIPGETVTLVGGFLAGSDELEYGYVLATASSGAFLGGCLGYGIGLWGGWPLLNRLGQLFRIEEQKLVDIKDQFSNNAAKTVLFGRFVVLLRIFVGPFAGLARMPLRTFLICNFIGSLAWALIMVSLAYFVGRLIPLATLVGWAAQFAVLALLIVVIWVGAMWWLENRQVNAEALESQD
ncbi:MAG: DedA family protein [Leptolyngbyaceae cyanobacterium MO_188.B28]|nr:DedA family protein [Leptolyngbyaceae cyanobacterium MO_188.B28]